MCHSGTIEQFERYQKAAKGLIRIITMATEHDERFYADRVIWHMHAGVIVSIGHSGATFEEAQHGDCQRCPQHDAYL